MRRLNTRAARTYARRTGRQFVDALFANALLSRTEGNQPRALQECHAILRYLQAAEEAPAAATNASPAVLQAQERGRADRLFWEAQCNSYIALLMMATGDYRNAIGWQTKNMDPRFDSVWRRVSYERLATMYLALGDVARALRKYDEMATGATTAYERLYWMLQGAQINVTYGDAIAVFDQWTAIERGLEQLSEDDRQRWSRDKQLQRVLRYMQRRLNVDVRDTVETALLRRVQEAPRETDWLYRQIAQLQRCRLQYERAAATYAQALALTQAHYAVYLDAAMLAYQRQQYARAVTLLSNMFLQSTHRRGPALSSDWRYVTLAWLCTTGKPAGVHDLLQRIDQAHALYATTSHWHNARGNVYALYNNFAAATNEFAAGLAVNPDQIDNYLDLGYLFCTRADAEETGLILDRLAARYPSNAIPRRVMQDWRTVELYHVSIRPYVVE
jgi:tetratricopeptide (TPR) repeat protein